jgi:hypothetical protein
MICNYMRVAYAPRWRFHASEPLRPYFQVPVLVGWIDEWIFGSALQLCRFRPMKGLRLRDQCHRACERQNSTPSGIFTYVGDGGRSKAMCASLAIVVFARVLRPQ